MKKETKEAMKKELDSWLGVPFRHMGITRTGIDCMNFIARILMKVGVLSENMIRYEYAEKWYHGTRESLIENALHALKHYSTSDFQMYNNKEQPQDGDICLFQWKDTYCVSHGGIFFDGSVYNANLNGVQKQKIADVEGQLKYIIRLCLLIFLFLSPLLDYFWGTAKTETVTSDPITAIVLTVVAITAAVASYFVVTSMGASNKIKNGMEANTLDQFRVTTVTEGTVVPFIFGTYRVNTNILDFRNLRTHAQKEKVKSGGKGGGSKSENVTKAYHYALDVHHGICQTPYGKADLIGTYINDKLSPIYNPIWLGHSEESNPVTPSDKAGGVGGMREVTWNDGTNAVFPTWSPNINRIKNICSLGIQGWYLGENVQTVPILHVVIHYTANTGISYENMTNGTNPAAVIYVILRVAGISDLKINTATFNASATYWNSKGYGVNGVFTSKMRASEAISKILAMVDGIIYRDYEGKFCLKAIDASESAVANIEEQEISEFAINRKTWDQLPNKFKATFIDPEQNYTQRTIIAENPAGIELAGKENTRSIDLTYFCDASSAAKRLDEIMKRESYPAMEIKFKTSLKYSTLNVGDVFTLSYPDYGILLGYFRVSTIEQPPLDSNEVNIQAIQVTERIFDSHFLTMGGTEWVHYNPMPTALTKVGAFELPYNSTSQLVPACTFLFSRENGVEDYVGIYTSPSINGTYELIGSASNWGLYGTLENAYGVTNICDNSTTGLTVNIYKTYTSVENLTRLEMFTNQRFLLCENEVMIFQYAEQIIGNQYKITNIVRGIFGTTVTSHSAGTPIWYVNPELIYLQNVNTYYKLLPYNSVGTPIELDDVTPLLLTHTNKAQTPLQPQVWATRSGSTVTFQVYPRTPSIAGFGVAETDRAWNPPPFPFEGYFLLEIVGISSYNYYVDSFTYSSASAFTAKVKHIWNGIASTEATVEVDTTDKTYKA